MDSIFEHYKKTGYLHHAHVIEGAGGDVVSALIATLERNVGVSTQGNPDFLVNSYDTFGVDDARAIKDAQSRAAFASARKIFIISARSFTPEAQNALLKTFEEPTPHTHFFIIIPRREILLPTLRSRVLMVEGVGAREEDEAKIFAEKFFDVSLEERLAMAKKIAEKKGGESVDRELFGSILDNLERMLYTRTAGSRDERIKNIFYEIHQAKKYLSDRGSSPKMLLEHIAITLS